MAILDRERDGRTASPTGTILDNQSVKAPHAAQRGYDAGNKITGRKRHIAVDTDGRLPMVRLTPADLLDSAGAQLILDVLRRRWIWLCRLFGGGAYDRGRLLRKTAFLDFTVAVIRRLAEQEAFKMLLRRWVIERPELLVQHLLSTMASEPML